MANYVTLRQGSGDKNAVMDLQKKLNTYGNAGLEVDGLFGPQTEKALKNYQRANGLQVDGIAGNETWGHLNSRSQSAQQPAVPQTAPVAAQPEKVYRYEKEKDPVWQAANQKVTDLEGSKPTIQGTYDQQVEQLFQELMGQKDFKYDLNGDPLWQQYKDQYLTQGKMASMDAMGQAAALTGGYGSSFGQTVGQQAYQGYVQQLNDKVPELYQLAMQKYAQEQALLKDKFTTAKGMQEDEYTKDMDKLGLWYQDLGLAKDDLHTAYEQGSSEWYTGEQLRREDEKTAYTKQQNAKNELMSLIASTGYVPSQAELEAAGMSFDEADAIRNQYLWEKGAEGRTQGRNDAVARAEMLAAGGDYSALAALYGMTEAQVAAAYAAQNAPEYKEATYADEQNYRKELLNAETESQAQEIWERIAYHYGEDYANMLYSECYESRVLDNEN